MNTFRLLLAVYRALRVHMPPEMVREARAHALGRTVAGFDALFRELIDDGAQSRLLSIVLRNALADYIATQTDAQAVLPRLTYGDRRLSVWCACAVSERHLDPKREYLHRATIETARAWVHGQATPRDCKKAAYAYAATTARMAATPSDIVYVAFPNSAASMASDVVFVAAYYATNDPLDTGASPFVFQRRLRELCVIIADAIRTYPLDLAP